MFNYVIVGSTVVGAYSCTKERAKILRALAPACGPTIKKGYRPRQPIPKAKRTKTGARQQIEPGIKSIPEGTHKIKYLKPGEFTL